LSRRNLSVIIVPHDRGYSRTIKTSYVRLKIAGVMAALCMIAVVAALGHYVILLKKTKEMSRLVAENRDLTDKVSHVDELSEKLESYEIYVQRINTLLGVSVSPEREQRSMMTAEDQPPPMDAGIEVVPAGGDRAILIHSMVGEIPSEWPLTRRGFITRGHLEDKSSHTGVDIAVPEQTPVRATASGLVSRIGWNNVYGNYIEIMHSDGYSTLYGHNSRLIVRGGQWVRRGEIIAFSGNTGRSTAPHLHYEVRHKGVAVDPQPYLLGYGKTKQIEG
jgi:murein DD-endopeptidase MepM/ murein hydrolase activator NlpD